MPSSTFEYLKNFYEKKGGHYQENDDELIYSIHPKSNILQSVVYIVFNDSTDFLKTLGVTDDEDIYTYDAFMGSYHYRDFDYYRFYEEFRDGYLIDGLNDKNKNLFNNILNYIPRNESAEEYLNAAYPREIDEIINIYGSEYTDCVSRSVQKIITQETKNPYKNFGIIEVVHGYKFKTTLGTLLRLYRVVGDYDLTISDLLETLIKKYRPNYEVGAWNELEYNTWCDDYDSEGVNDRIQKELETIFEDISERASNGYNELINKILDFGGFGKQIKTKVLDRSVIFDKIENLEYPIVFFRLLKQTKNGVKVEKRSLKTIDELNMVMYQPELFESFKKILRKLL